jgi:hypothetical protein
MENGQQIHRYSELVINSAGNLAGLLQRFRSGDFVFLSSSPSTTYGETFIPRAAMERILPNTLSIFKHDSFSLAQDVFLLVKDT